MKRILLLFMLISFSVLMNAQKWGLPSSTWIFEYSWLSPVNYITVKVKGDTIIDGINCKNIGNIYSYESNDTVYLYLEGKFRPTYYFNAQIGDTISFLDINRCGYWDGGGPVPDDSLLVYAVIYNIDSISVGNGYLKRFKSNITNRDSSAVYGNLEYSYIERIGSNYLYPHLYCADIFDQESFGICDYGDSTIPSFYVFQNPCIAVSVDEPALSNKNISLHPNPATTHFTITTPHNLTGNTLNIHNTIGQQVATHTIPSNHTISLHQLPKGIYYIQTHHLTTPITTKLIIR